MKTIFGIEKEISDLATEIKSLEGLKKKRAQKRIDFLKTMKSYLELQNDEEAFKAQREKLRALIQSKNGQYNYWKNPFSSPER